jgi:hypothetical protein
MIAGAKRREITSKEAHISYGRRYDIEHFFRFGKQRLGLVNSQTCETRHEESWHWIGLLSYNMLYHARHLTQAVTYPWEKRKVRVITGTRRPSQVQRDYGRIIREIGTPAPVPKPRGKSPGRELGYKIGEKPDRPLIWKTVTPEDLDKTTTTKRKRRRSSPKNEELLSTQRPKLRYMQRVWAKNRPPPMRC